MDSIILSYTSINFSNLVCLLFVLPAMIITILITKLFVSSDINKLIHKCSPISYYFGERTGCSKMIYENSKIENFETRTNNKKIDFMIILESFSKSILILNEKIQKKMFRYLVKTFKFIYASF